MTHIDLPGDCWKKHLGDGVTLSVQTQTTPDIEPRPSGVRIVIERTIEPRKISDVLVAAFEGGSVYWIDRIERKGRPPGCMVRVPYHSDWIERGGTLAIWADEDDKEYVLTLESFAAGCVRAAEFADRDFQEFLDDHDANDADVALQFALFDEIVYG